MWQYTPTNELMHYGKKGMKWGVSRAQNKALNKAGLLSQRPALLSNTV